MGRVFFWGLQVFGRGPNTDRNFVPLLSCVHLCIMSTTAGMPIVEFYYYFIRFAMSHTILLIQPSGKRPESRTYSDYESLNECLEGVCRIYEEHLKRQHPSAPQITYDVAQLFGFIGISFLFFVFFVFFVFF